MSYDHCLFQVFLLGFLMDLDEGKHVVLQWFPEESDGDNLDAISIAFHHGRFYRITRTDPQDGDPIWEVISRDRMLEDLRTLATERQAESHDNQVEQQWLEREIRTITRDVLYHKRTA